VRIRAAAEVYLDELRARSVSASLMEQVRRSLGRLASHLSENGVTQVRDIEEQHLASFARELMERPSRRGAPLSSSSRATYLQRVKSFMASLARKGLILDDPAKDLPLPTAAPLPRVILSVSQAARLVESPCADTSAGRRDRAILELLYGTGLRRGECARLDVGDLSLRARTLLVRNGKGSQDRMVPVTGRALAALGAYLKDVRPQLVVDPGERALFLTAWRGRRLSPVAVSYQLRGYGRKAGTAKVHPHALRHTCATHLLKGGADVRHVQALLGHRRLQSTTLYTRVVTEDLAEVLAWAHPREKGKRNGKRRPRHVRLRG
jgi:integrase/recombinase XerD